MADTGIVHHDIEPPLFSSHLFYGSLDLRLIGHIERLYACTPSSGLNLSRNALRQVRPDVGKNDVRPLLRKESCDLLANARSSPCHKGDFLI